MGFLTLELTFLRLLISCPPLRPGLLAFQITSCLLGWTFSITLSELFSLFSHLQYGLSPFFFLTLFSPLPFIPLASVIIYFLWCLKHTSSPNSHLNSWLSLPSLLPSHLFYLINFAARCTWPKRMCTSGTIFTLSLILCFLLSFSLSLSTISCLDFSHFPVFHLSLLSFSQCELCNRQIGSNRMEIL